MFRPYTRHLILLFAVGFAWGYVTKTIVGKYHYIGWNDPQVITQFDVIDVSTLTPTQPEPLQDIEDSPEE